MQQRVGSLPISMSLDQHHDRSLDVQQAGSQLLERLARRREVFCIVTGAPDADTLGLVHIGLVKAKHTDFRKIKNAPNEAETVHMGTHGQDAGIDGTAQLKRKLARLRDFCKSAAKSFDLWDNYSSSPQSGAMRSQLLENMLQLALHWQVGLACCGLAAQLIFGLDIKIGGLPGELAKGGRWFHETRHQIDLRPVDFLKICRVVRQNDMAGSFICRAGEDAHAKGCEVNFANVCLWAECGLPARACP